MGAKYLELDRKKLEKRRGRAWRVVRDGGDRAKKGLDKVIMLRLLPFPWLLEAYF